MFFHQFPWGSAVSLTVKTFSQFQMIFIWKGTLSKHWHSHTPWKNRWKWWESKLKDGFTETEMKRGRGIGRAKQLLNWQWKGAGEGKIERLKMKLTSFFSSHTKSKWGETYCKCKVKVLDIRKETQDDNWLGEILCVVTKQFQLFWSFNLT